MRCWVQESDFESSEFEVGSAREALQAFESHDWTSSLARQTKRESEGLETCPPGIGFVAPDGRILHLCPTSGDVAIIHYHYIVSDKLLGLVPRRRQETVTAEAFPRRQVGELLREFFRTNHEWLISNVRGEAAY